MAIIMRAALMRPDAVCRFYLTDQFFFFFFFFFLPWSYYCLPEQTAATQLRLPPLRRALPTARPKAADHVRSIGRTQASRYYTVV